MSVFAGARGQRFVDRGDPAAVDWDLAALTVDGAWHDLDLSGIVPADAGGSFVAFQLSVTGTSVGLWIQLRTKGKTNTATTIRARTQVAGNRLDAVGLVPCDSARLVEYRAVTSANWTALDLTVLGWWAGG